MVVVGGAVVVADGGKHNFIVLRNSIIHREHLEANKSKAKIKHLLNSTTVCRCRLDGNTPYNAAKL